MGDETTTFDQAMGAWMRDWRTAFDVSQGRLAGFMRRKGQAWEQTTVAKVESGRRTLSAAELCAFQWVLDEWSQHGGGGDVHPTMKVDRVVDVWAMPAGAREALDRDVGPKQYGSGPDPETKRVAATLEVDATWLDRRSVKRWGCSFPEERDRRALAAAEAAGATSLRAYRGHASRALMAELSEDIRRR